MNEFNLYLTYAKGDRVKYKGLNYKFKPSEDQDQYSLAVYPSSDNRWEII